MWAKSRNRGIGDCIENHAKTSTSTCSISALCAKDTNYVSDRAIDVTAVDCMLDGNSAGDT